MPFRLPNDAFGDTKAVSDILFLQKRERPVLKDDDLGFNRDNRRRIVINQYYIDHPEMILGTIEKTSCNVWQRGYNGRRI